MPLLSIETNQTLAPDVIETLLDDASKELATLLAKPEHYIMLRLAHNPHMRFGGDAAPLAYVEFKSLGLPEQKTGEFSKAVADLLSRHTDIPPGRVYIEFASPDRHLWGYDGGTF